MDLRNLITDDKLRWTYIWRAWFLKSCTFHFKNWTRCAHSWPLRLPSIGSCPDLYYCSSLLAVFPALILPLHSHTIPLRRKKNSESSLENHCSCIRSFQLSSVKRYLHKKEKVGLITKEVNQQEANFCRKSIKLMCKKNLDLYGKLNAINGSFVMSVVRGRKREM